MRRIVYSNNFNDFQGAGFASEPAAGQLDSDEWQASGFSSDSDFARGVTDGNVGTGGIYAVERGDGNNGLLIQPGGSDFTPGDLTLSLNSGETALSDVTVSFERLVINDKDRANSFDLSYSLDGELFIPVNTFTSGEASDVEGLQSETVSVSIPDLAANMDFFLRWTGGDVSGSGARDEFGIDTLVVEGTEGEGGGGGTGTSEIYVESFEGAPGTTYTLNGAFDDGGFDFFGRYAVPDTSNGARDDFTRGFDGDFAVFAQDNDGEGGPATQVIGIPDVDLTGYDAPTVTIALGAADSAAFNNYEGGDGIRIYATLDDGGRALVGQFVPENGSGNLVQDTDLDGTGDGDTLTTTLTDYTFDLPEGDTLSLEIELTSDASFEPLVVDNVRIGDDSAGGGDTGGGDGSIDDEPTLISTIQGEGAASALVGQTVVIEGIVTGDFQNGDADDFRSLGGFFVMEEDSDRDGNDATSEGIFAFEGSGDLLVDVNGGDLVRVLGTVIERFGKTTIEVTEIRVEQEGAVDPLSLAVSVDLPDADGREALESMLVTINEELTFSESFQYEAFGEGILTSDGPVYQYSQINTPDAAGNAAYQAEVADRSIVIDDGTNGSRGDLDPLFEPDGDLITNPDGIRMGQTVDSVTAILDYDFGNYRLRLPDEAAFDLDEDSNPLEDLPLDVGSDYKVASLNVLNYFTTIEGLTDIGDPPRGADNAEELLRQTDKLVTTILAMDADVIGLVEIENDFAGDTFAIKSLVGEINARLGAETYAYVDPGQEFVGGDAIAVAFIYDTTTTALVGSAAILDSDAFIDPLDAGRPLNRAALAQTFEEIASGGEFTASVNHLKSKGSASGDTRDEDQGDGAGRNNETRTEAAKILADWLESDPTGAGDDDIILLGDLNSYAKEDPLVALADAGYTDLGETFEGADVYSYRFSGQIGTLDYALANEGLVDQVTGATTWNINSDAPVFFDYNLDGTFTDPLRPTDQGLFDGTSPSRASDHDPIIVGLDLEGDTEIFGRAARNDRLNGTDLDERIDGLGGRHDVVSGGGGADTFVFSDTAGASDFLRILDFDTAEDVLDLGDFNIAKIRDAGPNVLITLEGGRDRIMLNGVDDFDDITIQYDALSVG